MHGLNYFGLHLTRIRHSFDDNIVFRALAPLSDAIKECAKRAEEAGLSKDPRDKDAVIDTEAELVENHLSSAFVTCQTFITSVVSHTKALHEYYEHSQGKRLTTTAGSTTDILEFGSPRVIETPFTSIFKYSMHSPTTINTGMSGPRGGRT